MILYTSNSKLPVEIDDEDFEKVKSHCHNLTTNSKGAVQLYSRIYGKTVKLSRVIMNCPIDDGTDVDHKDRDKLNNKKDNLRIATFKQNSYNKEIRKDSTSNFKCVSWCNTFKKWKVRVSHNGVRYSGGYFISKKFAAIKANEMIKKYHGEFAVLNSLENL